MVRAQCRRYKSVIVRLHVSAFTGCDLLPTQTLGQLQVTAQDLSYRRQDGKSYLSSL